MDHGNPEQEAALLHRKTREALRTAAATRQEGGTSLTFATGGVFRRFSWAAHA